MRRSQQREQPNSSSLNGAAIKPCTQPQWDPANYKPLEFYGELAELFTKLRIELGPRLDQYIICLKQFVKQCISGYELSTAVEKMMSSDLLHVHDQFVRVLSQSCQL
ncbi:unnamed protein product, partial [Heligmosomoides polygyrus]|uniref:HDAC_interact domain-containing protein n=1 Tax=Heligmosomoides polygyrus TaxID=6339 RepID=A0A183GRY6_HELPZ